MRNARIIAKLISETVIEDIADNPNAVRVTLTLQDDVINSYRVVIENDRPLGDTRQNVPVPRILTGTTEQQYVTLQNAGRDEIEVLPSDDFQTLNRQLKQFAQLKQKITGGELTMAYVVDSVANWPVLQYETKQREVFDTVAASIEFSKTTMVVDSSGAYRALQNFQINNRSEQYLEIELPTGAQLLTVLVQGQPVKPVAWPAAQNERRLRIPLVKTPLGDLDYPVQLKYAGKLGELSNFSEIEFPVIETLNINVQLSQLHLRLPDSHRWMNFGGTMTKVDDRGELEESYLSYKRRQIEQLADQIRDTSSKMGSFSKSRAYSNLKQLESDMEEFQSANLELQSGASNKQLQELYFQNSQAIEQAQQLYSVENSNAGEIQVDNRANFNGLVEGQNLLIARNSVTRQGRNFDYQVEPQKPGEPAASQQPSGQTKNELAYQEGKKSFDGEWFERNQLNALVDGEKSSGKSAIATKQPPRTAIVAETTTVQSDDDSISFVNPNDALMLGLEVKDQESDQTKFRPGLADQRESSGAGLGSGMDELGNAPARAEGGGFGGGAGGGRGRDAGDEMGGDGGLEFPSATEWESRAQRRTKFNGNLRQDSAGQPADGGKLSEASLTSLDIELPQRGVDFYFKSPRGKATVMVRPVESRSFSSGISALITIGIAVGIGLVCWLVLWLSRSKTLRVIGIVALLAAGLISLVTGILPVYGLIALAAAIFFFIDWGTRMFWGGESPEMS